MKNRDVYFILCMVAVVGVLMYLSSIRRFKPLPTSEHHLAAKPDAPFSCAQCHEHPKKWNLPDRLRPILKVQPGPEWQRPVPELHPPKTQCLRCHEEQKMKP